MLIGKYFPKIETVLMFKISWVMLSRHNWRSIRAFKSCYLLRVSITRKLCTIININYNSNHFILLAKLLIVVASVLRFIRIHIFIFLYVLYPCRWKRHYDRMETVTTTTRRLYCWRPRLFMIIVSYLRFNYYTYLGRYLFCVLVFAFVVISNLFFIFVFKPV